MDLPFITKKGALLNPAQLRAKKIAEENKERFEKIAQRLLDVASEENVTVIELPIIVSVMTGKINNSFNGAEIKQILKLGKEKL